MKLNARVLVLLFLPDVNFQREASLCDYDKNKRIKLENRPYLIIVIINLKDI